MSEGSSKRKKSRRLFVEGDILGYPLPDASDMEQDPEFPDFWFDANADVFDGMEEMLALIHKSRPTKPAVDNLRLCLGCGNTLYRTDRYVLQRLGMNRLDALFFSLVPELARLTERTSYGEHPRIGRLEEASGYLASNFIGLQDEYFYLFCLNHHGKLKERVLLHKGIEDRALFDLNTVTTEMMRADPAAIIVAHNHPQGTLRPSEADILCTEELLNSCAMLGIPLLDHVIVADGAVVSLRDNGFIPEAVWLEQDPGSALLRAWLQEKPPIKEKPAKILSPEEEAAAAEKKRQAERRLRLHRMDNARREHRRRIQQAEKAMRVYRRLCIQDILDQEKHPQG